MKTITLSLLIVFTTMSPLVCCDPCKFLGCRYGLHFQNYADFELSAYGNISNDTTLSFKCPQLEFIWKHATTFSRKRSKSTSKIRFFWTAGSRCGAPRSSKRESGSSPHRDGRRIPSRTRPTSLRSKTDRS